MRQISCQVEIGAPAQRVWEVLSVFPEYPYWNPFIINARGKLKEGERIELTLLRPGKPEAKHRPKVTGARPERELRWRAKLGLPGILDGEHVFRIEPLGDSRVRFTQIERFTGILVPLMGREFFLQTLAGFELMNQAIKQEAETPFIESEDEQLI